MAALLLKGDVEPGCCDMVHVCPLFTRDPLIFTGTAFLVSTVEELRKKSLTLKPPMNDLLSG